VFDYIFVDMDMDMHKDMYNYVCLVSDVDKYMYVCLCINITCSQPGPAKGFFALGKVPILIQGDVDIHVKVNVYVPCGSRCMHT
jgi:hypothetical protein